MITKVYFVEKSLRTNTILDLLEKKIPCFADRKPSVSYHPDCITYIIQCRVEDVPTVDKMLAPIVKKKN